MPQPVMHFPTDKESIEKRIAEIDPVAYAKSRNFLNGSVTHMSPYITHGYISLPQLRDRVLQRYSKKDAYTFIFELAWREFFQRTWEREGDGIFYSLKHEQDGVVHEEGLPQKYLEKNTSIIAADKALVDLEQSGYVHNHARMWLAMLVTNVAKVSWWEGARHMYYHLLDGDRASNSLSWQWVAGTFSSKKYFANQSMINRFAKEKQFNTYLDKEVEHMHDAAVPEQLAHIEQYELKIDDTVLKANSVDVSVIQIKETWLYSIWTLDPKWEPTKSKSEDVQKILYIEKEDLELFPMSEKRLSFIVELSKNIEGLKIIYGDINDLYERVSDAQIYRKHHAALTNWKGIVSAPEYLFPQVTHVPGGFMSFWKKCEEYL